MIHANPMLIPTWLAHAHWEAPSAVHPLMNLSLPITLSQLSQLRQLARPSRGDLGNMTHWQHKGVLRSRHEIDGNRITLSIGMMNTIKQMRKFILGQVSWELGYVMNVMLHKLLLYEEGEFVVRQRNTDKWEGVLGTVVVFLPTETLLQGGSVRVHRPVDVSWTLWRQEQEEERLWNVSQLETSRRGDAWSECQMQTRSEDGSGAVLNWIMFWSDCYHEVERVSSGHLVVLEFVVLARPLGTSLYDEEE